MRVEEYGISFDLGVLLKNDKKKTAVAGWDALVGTNSIEKIWSRISDHITANTLHYCVITLKYNGVSLIDAVIEKKNSKYWCVERLPFFSNGLNDFGFNERKCDGSDVLPFIKNTIVRALERQNIDGASEMDF